VRNPCETYTDFKLPFLQKGKNLDEFDIPAYLKADREKILQEQEQQQQQQQQDVVVQDVATESPVKLVPDQPPSENTHRPKSLGVFAGFDSDEDD
jgi:hypothetical protein